ncbi:MAG: glycosyl hydrolase [Flavobacterium sp.]|nr:MAG: glycosyl hydrolase [Flavobacterium sp.]
MSVKKIAIYLPQFHAIAENDKAWGEGFTEWTNVKKATPLFDGHYQPHVPQSNLGYYDLSDTTVMQQQADLALEYGIDGFAYYHYWFNGKRLLHQPLDSMLEAKKPNIPFCYIWANENWTKRWDGADQEVIIDQEYSDEDDLAHIKFLCEKVFSDERYIRIDDKPVFLIYRTELFPDIGKTAQLWRRVAKTFGFKDLYLIRMENFVKGLPPDEIGFDAAMEFAPDWNCVNTSPRKIGNKTLYDYRNTVYNMILKSQEYKYFHCVFPGWDNTPRRKALSGSIFINNDPTFFKFFLQMQLRSTLEKFPMESEQLLFINAWNEWGEGCHIEPDEKHGMLYLEICRDTEAAAPEDFKNFCKDEINSLRDKNATMSKELEILQRKYNHMLGNPFYKSGKKVQTVIASVTKLLGKR